MSKLSPSIVADNTNLITEDDEFDKIAAGGSTFPYLKLFIGASDACKEEKVGINCFAVVPSKNSYIDLGKEINILVLACRYCAMQTGSNFVVNYDFESDKFKEIVKEADEKDTTAFYGPMFLVWVLEAKKFASFFCNTKTLQNEAPAIRAPLKKWSNGEIELPTLAFGSKLIDNGTYKWQAVASKTSSAVFDNLPEEKDFSEAITKFSEMKNVDGPKKAEEDTSGRER